MLLVLSDTPDREETARAQTIHSYCGPVRLFRTHGWCRKCEQWVFPADTALGLFDNSTASPLVQEMCALLVSKMPCEQAEPVASRVAGIQLSRSTMAREAQRQGERAIQMRQKQSTAPPVAQPPTALAAAGLDQPPKPFTMVIQIDAWNIRERDDWGKTQAKLKRGEKIERWHWVYTATCFRLEQRVRKGKRRAVITERSYVATRQGIEPMMKQLHHEAMARGLAEADQVLVIADGAVWIWKPPQTVTPRPSSVWISSTLTPISGPWPIRSTEPIPPRRVNGSSPCSNNSNPTRWPRSSAPWRNSNPLSSRLSQGHRYHH